MGYQPDLCGKSAHYPNVSYACTRKKDHEGPCAMAVVPRPSTVDETCHAGMAEGNRIYQCALPTGHAEPHITKDRLFQWYDTPLHVSPNSAPVHSAPSAENDLEVNANGATQSKLPYRFDLIDPKALERLAAVRYYGTDVKGYAPDNWRGIDVASHLNHALYHVNQFRAGDQSEDHLGHAFCRLMFAVALADEENCG